MTELVPGVTLEPGRQDRSGSVHFDVIGVDAHN